MEEKEITQQDIENAIESLEDITQDEYMFEPIDMDREDVTYLPYDFEEFNAGIKATSKVCGMLAALKGVGLTWDQCMEMVINLLNIDHNLNLADKNNATTITVAEKQQANLEKTQL